MTQATSISRSHTAVRLRNLWLGLFISLCLLLLVMAVALAAFEFSYAERIYPGVAVVGIPLGGKTPAEAEAMLAAVLDPYPIPAIVLRADGRHLSLRPEDVGAHLDVRATVAAAYRVGRDGSFLENLRVHLQTLYAGFAVSPVVTYDERQVRFVLERWAQELYRPAREAHLEFQGTHPVIVSGQPGREIDVTATLAVILERLSQGHDGVVDAVLRERPPVISDLITARDAIQRLLAGPITLVSPDGSLAFALDPVMLAQMMRLERRSEANGRLTVVPVLDEVALTARVEQWAKAIAIEPRDARLDFDPETGTFTTLVPSQTGRELDVAEAVRRIQQAASSGGRTQELPIRVIPPAVDEARVAEMGIKELVAQGTSRFAGSSAERVQNIVTAVEKIRGVVIPPGGEFSFNRAIGDVTAANGFEDSLIIWGDRTAVGIGGGVCQVSTTVFRAAFFGGFPILERWAHGYVVRWYGDPGLDATIYTPEVDFRFRNDTEHFLLIKPEVDLRRGILTVSLYGTRPDRTVEMEGPIIENRRPAPEPVYQVDPSLPPGARKQVDWPAEGMDVTVKRVIRDGSGKVIGRDTFVSHYQPWRAVYLVGPTVETTPMPESTPVPQTQALSLGE
ncbi:MAG: VanW family protein [Anaerolineae bacterium]|nr:VanW family protein [Anaerolineae bacterium]MDW8100739.1 VanW family protein [Anaerolineae bacterium]